MCGAAGSMTSTFTMVLSTTRRMLPSEIVSMSVRFRCFLQVDGKTYQTQTPTSYDDLAGRLVDKLAMVGLLVKTPYAGEAMLLAYSPE